MLTILHIIESLADFGGTPRKLLYLTRNIDQSEYRQIFLCYLNSPLKNEFEQSGAIVECVDSTNPIVIIRRALLLIGTYKVNAVCTHFTRPLIIGYLAAQFCRIPVIHNEHSSAHYRQGLGRIFSRFILPRIQISICNSEYTLNSVKKEFNVPLNKLVVVYNPVEKRGSTVSRADMRRLIGVSGDELVVGHVGGMIPQRDQSTLIKAFARLKIEYPHSKLVLIGDGSERGKLESLSVVLGLDASVIFIGYTDQIGDYLSAIDIYVNPTLDEGFGIAVVEAMFAGLPVVLSDQGAHPELIEDGVSGILYRGGNSNSLTEALSKLAGNSEVRNSLGAAAVIRALACFQPSNYAVGYSKQIQIAIESYVRLTRKES